MKLLLKLQLTLLYTVNVINFSLGLQSFCVLTSVQNTILFFDTSMYILCIIKVIYGIN